MITKFLIVMFALALLLGGCLSAAERRVQDALQRGDVTAAVEVYRQDNRRDARLLLRIAEAVLERAVLEPGGTRDAALNQLAMSGTSARAVLQHLAEDGGGLVRARALLLLSKLGEHAARNKLEALLDSPDMEVAAVALLDVEPARHAPRLRMALRLPASPMRLAAATRLGQAPPQSATLRELIEAARRDPDLAVRAAAARALAAQGAAASQSLETLANDEEAAVRSAAIGALLKVDRARALRVLDRQLDADPSSRSIEAARRLMMAAAKGRYAERAEGLLGMALTTDDSKLRAAAAVAMLGLPADSTLRALLAQRAETEKTAAVRLSIMLALGSDHAGARKGLQALMAGGDLTSSQAARELAVSGDVEATAKLVALTGSKSAAVRRVVARALARDLGRPHDVRGLLSDSDASVRITTAGAILAGSSWWPRTG